MLWALECEPDALAFPAMAVGFLLNFVGIWKEFIFAITFLHSQKIYPG